MTGARAEPRYGSWRPRRKSGGGTSPEDKLEPYCYPRSWLARTIAEKQKPETPVVKLPPMQRKVLDLLCRKMSTEEIAQYLGLSPHTIRNHLKAVFRAYRVNNRAALIAEIALRGELTSSS